MDSTETTTPRGMGPRTKNMLVIMGIIGSIIIGALLIYGILVTPSRQPYRNALTQFENVMKANARLTAAGTSLNAANASGEDFEKAIQAAQLTIKSLRTENEALAKEGVLQDGEGKAKYEAYNKKLQEYMTYNENILTSMLKVRPVLVECNKDMTDTTVSAESIAALRDCGRHLGELKKVADADYRQLAGAFEQDYNNLADVLEEYAALLDPRGADKPQADVLAVRRDEAMEQLSFTTEQFKKDLQVSRKQILATDSEKKLSDFLKAKSRIF